jgi:FtsP/CotA-like multicopper oxidase with cupredoxin domain
MRMRLILNSGVNRFTFLNCFPVFSSVLALSLTVLSGSAQTTKQDSVPAFANPSPRPPAGSTVRNPPALYSRDGLLIVNFSYQTTTDSDGRTLFFFVTPDGLENPTLHVHPGDHLIINLTNNTPASPVDAILAASNYCGDIAMTKSSVNLHFHGTNTLPVCREDEVIRTIINSGQTFRYDIHFPSNEPPGLYWYHPHLHGLVEAALQGGASGAIVVDGIQRVKPEVAGLRHRIFMIRDQNVLGNPPPGGRIPSWDLTLNFVPIAYPREIPAVIQMRSARREFWRIANASADSLLDLQLRFDGVPQRLQIVALDGVPVDSQDGFGVEGKAVTSTHLLIPTAGRAEVIVPAPSPDVKKAELITQDVHTGQDGDNDPHRVLATIENVSDAAALEAGDDEVLPDATAPNSQPRFAGLATAPVDTKRALYFSEDNPKSHFYITVDGAKPTLYKPGNTPAIVTTQGSVEDWTIQNRTLENHEFHIHQIHFLVLSQDNFETNGSRAEKAIEGQFMDTIQVPYWDGNPKHPYPSVTLRMDFRGPDVGDFVYHCHIAEHEDDGMMAIITVLPR